MRRWGLLTASACVISLAFAPTAGAGGKPSYGCAPGFNLGAVTFDEWVALPRSQAAIDAGLISAEEIVAGLLSVDKNGNGVVCAQLSVGLEVGNRPFGEYFYNVVDDNASVGG